MRKSLSASILLLALCCPAFAGDMPTPPAAPLPSPSPTAKEPASGGEVTSPTVLDDSLTTISVILVESALALL
jgi:hypothetical protein